MNKQDLDNYITGHYGEDQFDEFDEGFEAFYCGVKLHENPYTVDSEAYNKWEDGYKEAVECDDEPI